MMRSSVAILVAVWVLVTLCGSAALGGLVPRIAVEPGTNIECGAEVGFSAMPTTYDDAGLLSQARFEWDFGDGYAMRYGSPYYNSADTGRACTDFYARPGPYTGGLTV